MEWIYTAEGWIALLSLTAIEIVLGIDNIIFISILAGRLPPDEQPSARRIGLLVALATRILLLLSLTWVMRLTAPLFVAFGNEISGRDLILIGGGLFLLAKSTAEIHHSLEGPRETGHAKGAATFTSVIVQIGLLDIVFSLDSVITAIGLAEDLAVMVIAVLVAIGIMLWSADAISDFVNRHPTIKVLALSFLVLIGVMLIADGFDQHIPKGYIYFAMAFSFVVEMINMRVRRRASDPVELHSRVPVPRVPRDLEPGEVSDVIQPPEGDGK